jgi:hypothetical protein
LRARPKEVLQAGSFGGTYFRPIYSSVTKKHYDDQVGEKKKGGGGRMNKKVAKNKTKKGKKNEKQKRIMNRPPFLFAGLEGVSIRLV